MKLHFIVMGIACLFLSFFTSCTEGSLILEVEIPSPVEIAKISYSIPDREKEYALPWEHVDTTKQLVDSLRLKDGFSIIVEDIVVN
jgi:hypothetical protein